jgi:hypothetical protein
MSSEVLSGNNLDSVFPSFGISPPERGPSRAIPSATFENAADRDELSAAAESESTESVHETCPSQDEGTNANGDRRLNTQPQLQIVQPSSQTFSTEIEIDFRQLDDGCRLEIVEDSADATKTKLAIFDGSKVQLVSKFEYRGNIFVPIARESDGLRDIVLPHAPNPYLSTEEILSRISGLASLLPHPT